MRLSLPFSYAFSSLLMNIFDLAIFSGVTYSKDKDKDDDDDDDDDEDDDDLDLDLDLDFRGVPNILAYISADSSRLHSALNIEAAIPYLSSIIT
jgi:hypothetical protein